MFMAREMLKGRGKPFLCPEPQKEIVRHTRGGQIGGVPIHAMRSPGVPYSGHEIMLSSPGQNLTLRDETLGPESYMPGVMLAIREVLRHKGLVRNWIPWQF